MRQSDDTIILQYYVCKILSRCETTGLKTYFVEWLFMRCICTMCDV